MQDRYVWFHINCFHANDNEQAVDYSNTHDQLVNEGTPKSKRGRDSDSDTDFMAPQSDANDSVDEQPAEADDEEKQAAAQELAEMKENKAPNPASKAIRSSTRVDPAQGTYLRATQYNSHYCAYF